MAWSIPAILSASALAQSAGPRDPGITGNDPGVGSNPWSNTGNSVSSNNAYATVATKGISQYLTATDLGFSIPSPSGIAGIQLDVERNTNGPVSVALLNGWSTGLAKSISAGNNRCLLVVHAQENGIDSRDITAMTYGGRPMTQVIQHTAGIAGAFTARLEVWMLLEADIALAGSTAIVPTYGGYTALEYCEVFSSAVFTNVDQFVPVFSTRTAGAQSSLDPHQLGTAFNTVAGGMAINLVTCGNRDSSNPAANSNTSSYPAPTGYTEGTDHYFANAAVPTTGACLQVIHKATATAGTEAPSCNFNGSVNRWAIIGFSLQRAREVDHEVKLIQGGSIGGDNLASTTSWPTTDSYSTYGGPTHLWGRTWTTAEINASTFGAALAARVQNGTARVDHMRISVYYYSTLPVELLYFTATPEGERVRLEWATATERDNDHFIVQRSADALDFTDIDQLQGAGSSQALLLYRTLDERPLPGTSYYRLVQVDLDGTRTLSSVVAMTRDGADPIVYPNPTSDGRISIHDPLARSLAVGIYDERMRSVQQIMVPAGDPLVHLQTLPDGAYTIVMRAGEEIHTSRVIKVSRTR